MGMENRKINDSQITASSTYVRQDAKPIHGPWYGRLNRKADQQGIGGWAAGRKTDGEYIQVDLGVTNVITMVSTQGRSSCSCFQWVTSYSLAYSDDGTSWKPYEGDCTKIFPGNTDKNTVVTNKLEIPIKARYIRLIVKGFNGHPTMRMELYGCMELSP
ncbi:Lactadherin [Exaiptasia diaphana]|nr:Lactadherin [Exaiptasia diaphana]